MRRQREGLSEPCIAWIAAGVLSALEYMHVTRKVIHRDIKAANILLTHEGQVQSGRVQVQLHVLVQVQAHVLVQLQLQL